MIEFTRISTYQNCEKMYLRVLFTKQDMKGSMDEQCIRQGLYNKELSISLDVRNNTGIELFIDDMDASYLYATPLLFEVLSRLNILLDGSGWKPGYCCSYVPPMRFLRVAPYMFVDNLSLVDSIKNNFHEHIREWMTYLPMVTNPLMENGHEYWSEMYEVLIEECMEHDNMLALKTILSSDTNWNYIDEDLLIKAERLIRDNN